MLFVVAPGSRASFHQRGLWQNIGMFLRVMWLLLTVALALTAQTDPFPDFTFTAPAGYQSRTHAAAIELTRVDQKRQFYCQFGIYASQPSQEPAVRDVDTEWNAVVTSQFKVRGEVVTKDLALPAAPQSAVRAAATTDGNGKPAVSTLFVLRFPNRRYVGVLFNTSNETSFEACQSEAMALVTSVRMKEGTTAPVPQTRSQAAPAGGAGSAPTAAGAYGPPGNPASGSVVGVWEQVSASQPAGRFNMLTKQWEYDPVAALSQFRQTRRFVFETNGRYLFELDVEDFSRSERSRVIERGRYTVQNGAIQFQPESYQDGKGRRGTDPPLTTKPVPAPHSRRFLLGDHPQYQNSVGLQLQTGNGGWETYRPAR
jgi:hypothetical protein